MKYEIALHKDKNLSHNIKYREQVFGAGQGQVWTGEVVSIGNFASKDLFGDNSVEISCPYETALTANFVRLKFEDWHTIGPIVHWEYINDQNTRIHYIVDAYSSAVASGRLENLSGLCDRVNSYCLEHWANLLPEPFAPSDISQANSTLTRDFTDFINYVEGFSAGTSHLDDTAVRFILTVSPAIIEFLGNPDPFTEPVSTFAQTFQAKSVLSFNGADATVHHGGIYRGTPLRFGSMKSVKLFIKRILGGCGFVTNTATSGFNGMELDSHMLVTFVDSPGGGVEQLGNQDNLGEWTETKTDTYNLTEIGHIANLGPTSNTVRGTISTNFTKGRPSSPLTYCRPITSADIYNLYCIPANFANNTPYVSYTSRILTGFRNYLNMSIIAPELPDKAKLAAYPYCYNKLVTANGDIVNIIPQSDYQTTLTHLDPNYSVYIKIAFFGGDTPRLMGMIVPARSDTNNIDGAVEQWFTIRSYPAITIALNDDLNQQRQRDFSNTKQIGAAGANARISSQLSSPIKTAFDGVGGSAPGQGKVGTWFGAVGGWAGRQFDDAMKYRSANQDAWAKLGYGSGGSYGQSNSNLFNDPSAAAAAMTANSLSGQIISPAGGTIMGNDFLGQLQQLPITVYNCGATDSELFSFARYLGKFGSAVSGPLNPRTNVGLLLGGRCLPQPFEGRTYYQFLSMEVEETIPRQWKDAIETLFKSGVWLIEN